MKIGILREEKSPPDIRVSLTPVQCRLVMKEYPGTELFVQPYPNRCFSDQEYADAGCRISEDLSSCDLLMGIKEIPYDKLIAGKKYMIFSHTIKKQPHNKKLFKAIVQHKVELIDYECLTDIHHNRIIGFGRYAGIVGAYNGILGYGRKYDLFDLKRACLCRDMSEVDEELKRIKLPNLKIVLTGGGRVANGASELLGALKIRKVTVFEFLNYSFREPVYVQLHSKDINRAKNGAPWNTEDFYQHPDLYVSTFNQYTRVCDLLMHCTFWDPRGPVLFNKGEMSAPDFRISVIADITCDVNGSIPSTITSSTIREPFYGYNPVTGELGEAFDKNTITVMAVDNLPCELPRDASEDFGKNLIERVFPFLFREDKEKMIERATLTRGGQLMPAFEYLNDYAFGE